MGVITEDDIPKEAKTNAQFVGMNHTMDSMTGEGPLSIAPIKIGDKYADLPVQVG